MMLLETSVPRGGHLHAVGNPVFLIGLSALPVWMTSYASNV